MNTRQFILTTVLLAIIGNSYGDGPDSGHFGGDYQSIADRVVTESRR